MKENEPELRSQMDAAVARRQQQQRDSAKKLQAPLGPVSSVFQKGSTRALLKHGGAAVAEVGASQHGYVTLPPTLGGF